MFLTYWFARSFKEHHHQPGRKKIRVGTSRRQDILADTHARINTPGCIKRDNVVGADGVVLLHAVEDARAEVNAYCSNQRQASNLEDCRAEVNHGVVLDSSARMEFSQALKPPKLRPHDVGIPTSTSRQWQPMQNIYYLPFTICFNSKMTFSRFTQNQFAMLQTFVGYMKH